MRASLVAQMVKNPPAMWENWVQPPTWEEGMATHFSIFLHFLKTNLTWTQNVICQCWQEEHEQPYPYWLLSPLLYLPQENCRLP